MIIAVDLDNTIVDMKNVRHGYRMGPPVTGALLALQHLVRSGHSIVIFTARSVNKPEVYKAVEDWLKYFNIPYHGITNIKKPEFELYIDDRALHFNNWPQVITDIAKFESDKPVTNSFNQAYSLVEDITKPLDI